MNSAIPYTILDVTQFFEFLKRLADLSFNGNKVRLPPVLFQPFMLFGDSKSIAFPTRIVLAADHAD
jgi:hypothetical protein